MVRTTTSDRNTLRFGDGVARILFSRDRTGAGPSVVELTMPEGTEPPLHVHDEEERVFVLEGRVTFTIGGEAIEAGPRTKLVLPAGVPHTYRVESAGRARWLVTSESGRYERFLRAVARPLTERGPSDTTLRDAVAFTVAAAQNGIQILAPAPWPPAGEASSAAARVRARRPRRAPALRLAAAAA